PGVALELPGVLVERMAGDVEADGLLLHRQPLLLRPLLQRRVLGPRDRGRRPGPPRVLQEAEERRLPHRTVSLGGGAPFQRLLDGLEQLPAGAPLEVERARLHQRLDDLPVDASAVDALGEIEEVAEWPRPAGLENGLDGALAHALDGAEAEA